MLEINPVNDPLLSKRLKIMVFVGGRLPREQLSTLQKLNLKIAKRPLFQEKMSLN